ncbi:MAG: endonuclease III [Deltaproteobacteria bacterium]|nr:endonuclease III [Deltaproteobacteria bacterium]
MKGDLKARWRKLLTLLDKQHPNARLELKFANPLELLVATILSAQCTDRRVNEVTKDLFRKYRPARDYAEADPAVFEEEIHSTGFYRAKTKSILACCRALVERHGGKVPDTMEALVQLPGVGRKTANIVLGNAFGKPGIAVDTHVFRVAHRLGLAKADDPDKVEQELNQVFPRPAWTRVTNLLIFHGRYVCKAARPDCPNCLLYALCPYPDKTPPTRKATGATKAVSTRGPRP